MSALMAVSALTENESLIFLTIILVDHCLHLVERNVKMGASSYCWFLNGHILGEFSCHSLVCGAVSETFATVTLIRSVAFQVKG